MNELLHVSTNYHKFKNLPFNRKLDRMLVNSLVRDIKKEGYDQRFPIKVTPDFEILDGQHRFEACRILSIPVYYECVDTHTEKEKRDYIKKANAVKKAWNMKSFLEFYKEESSFHQKILELSQKYEITHSPILKIIAYYLGGDASRKLLKKIKTGEDIQIPEYVDFFFEDYDRIRQIILKLHNHPKWKNHLKSQFFIVPVYKFWKFLDHDITELAQKIENNVEKLEICSSTHEWEKNLVYVWNWRRQSRKIIIDSLHRLKWDE